MGLVAAAGISAAAAIGGGLISKSGANKAANVQAESNAQAIAEQRRQFDMVQQLLAPYVQAGNSGLSSLLALTGAAPVQTNWQAYAQSNPALMQAFQAQQTQQGSPFAGGLAGIRDVWGRLQSGQGLPGMGGTQDLATFAQQWQKQNDPNANLSQFQTGGAQAQRQAIAGIESSPLFQSLLQQGEQGILQNASATGGLRGGNVQGALAQFRPAMLNQQIQQQLANFSGLASLGQNAAAGTGNAGIQTGANVSSLLQDTGQARAYGALGGANALGSTVASLGSILGGVLGRSGGGGSLTSVLNTGSGFFPGAPTAISSGPVDLGAGVVRF